MELFRQAESLPKPSTLNIEIMKLLNILTLSTVLAAGIMHAQKADMIITNGKITTMDDKNPEAQAVAIKDHKILQVGTNAQILKLKNGNTKVIDAKGNRVIPGLFDSHLHVIRGGRFYNTELRWDGVKSLKRALEMLKEQAQRTPKGQWVRVIGGWNEYQFEEKDFPHWLKLMKLREMCLLSSCISMEKPG